MISKRIIVTGASGFIGSKLTHQLVVQGYKPYVQVRSESNLKSIIDLKNKIKIHYFDLRDKSAVFSNLKSINPHIIYHLAGQGVNSYTSNTSDSIQDILSSNIEGTINLLIASQRLSSLDTFVNTGSCFEYGNSSKPFSETSCLSPCNVYGTSKACTTLLAKVYAKNCNLPIVSLRLFTPYGPGESSNRFISTVIRRCLNNQNPQITTQTITRDYVYIDDLINAYISAGSVGQRFFGSIFNISTGTGTTTETISKLIIKLTGKQNLMPDIGSFPTRKGEVINITGNPDLAKKSLKWQHSTPLKTGLQKTIDWIKQNG